MIIRYLKSWAEVFTLVGLAARNFTVYHLRRGWHALLGGRDD